MVYFDFELWERLAREEPYAFEVLRKQVIEYEINRASSSLHKKLPCLQFRIDMERKRSGSAMGGCIAISKMMMDHLYNELHLAPEPVTHSTNSKIKADEKIVDNNVVELFK